MTYEYEEGQVPVPRQTCVRCGTRLETEVSPGGRTVGWFLTSALDATTWVFGSRGAPPAGASERLRCPKCDRRYVHLLPLARGPGAPGLTATPARASTKA